MSNNISLYIWRENLDQLENCLSLCDEIDAMLKERAKTQKYIYSSYVDIDELHIKGLTITLSFEAREMEFAMLQKVSKLANDHNLVMTKNTHEYKAKYTVTLEFMKMSDVRELGLN